MKPISIEVASDYEYFNLAFDDSWHKAAGHLITVDKFQFSAVFVGRRVIISDLESGCKAFERTIPDNIESYEQCMLYMSTFLSAEIVKLITLIGEKELRKKIKEMKDAAYERLGAPTEVQG